MIDPISVFRLANREEHPSFFRNALAWHGSATPRVVPRVIFFVVYATIVRWLFTNHPEIALDLQPFEYSGVVLGLLLVFRSNAGYDRWWEGRKLWGSIVNQSRNLALAGLSYGPSDPRWRKEFVAWVACLPHAMRMTLRGEKDTADYVRLVGASAAQDIASALHMPNYVALRINALLNQARESGTDGFAFLRMDRERALLIDAIGACERILKTPIPLVYAIKVRRFIFIFLMLLPFAMIQKVEGLTPLLTFLVAYPLLSLDQIGYELQNPFSAHRLSHLPLTEICKNIENNVLALESESRSLEPTASAPSGSKASRWQTASS